MKPYFWTICIAIFFGSCNPSVKLTATWSDAKVSPVRFTKILVLSIGKDLRKRKLAEDKIMEELQKHGFVALTALDQIGPDLAQSRDSAKTQQLLLDKQFDACLTVRVLNVHEQNRWVPASVFLGPAAFYRGFYGYYFQVYGYYVEPGYNVTDVEVLLESNLYNLTSGKLLWSGQSKAFSKNPTPEMAAIYARNIVKDIINKHVIIP
jgi:hypothetical protein